VHLQRLAARHADAAAKVERRIERAESEHGALSELRATHARGALLAARRALRRIESGSSLGAALAVGSLRWGAPARSSAPESDARAGSASEAQVSASARAQPTPHDISAPGDESSPGMIASGPYVGGDRRRESSPGMIASGPYVGGDRRRESSPGAIAAGARVGGAAGAYDSTSPGAIAASARSGYESTSPGAIAAGAPAVLEWERSAFDYGSSLTDWVAAVALARAEDGVPEQAGPYNPLRIANDLLERIRQVSPIYLNAQLSWLEALASMLALPELPEPPAPQLMAATRAARPAANGGQRKRRATLRRNGA
jgi:hypothetical protein